MFQDPLEFTVTKTLIEVLGVLSESFIAAYTKTLSVRKLPKAPYRLINKTGLNIAVNLRESGLRVSNFDSRFKNFHLFFIHSFIYSFSHYRMFMVVPSYSLIR